MRLLSRLTATTALIRRLRMQRNNANIRAKDVPVKTPDKVIAPSWPPVKDHVDFLSVKELFISQASLIQKILQTSGLSDTEKDKYLMPVLTNLAKYVHLLPASEYTHHQGYGGLFAHSLEVGLFCANKTKLTNFSHIDTPKSIEVNRRRWVLSGLFCGLLHDVGKAVTDLTITDQKGIRWQHETSLVDWLMSRNASRYYISYVAGRGKNEHCSVALTMISDLIPEQTRKFLSEGGFGDFFMKSIRLALEHGKEEEGGLLGKILIEADSLSCELDMQKSRAIPARYKNVSHPQADSLLKAIRALLNEGKWEVNTETGRVFITRMGCFIEFTAGAKEAYSQATEMEFKNLPNDALGLANILVASGAAIPDTEFEQGMSLAMWSIRPVCMDKNIRAVRITDPQLIFGQTPPPPIAVTVAGRKIDPKTAEEFKAKWNKVPVSIMSSREIQELGYTEELLKNHGEKKVLLDEETGEEIGFDSGELLVDDIPLAVFDACQGNQQQAEEEKAASGEQGKPAENKGTEGAAPAAQAKQEQKPQPEEGAGEIPERKETVVCKTASRETFMSLLPENCGTNVTSDVPSEQTSETPAKVTDSTVSQEAPEPRPAAPDDLEVSETDVDEIQEPSTCLQEDVSIEDSELEDLEDDATASVEDNKKGAVFDMSMLLPDSDVLSTEVPAPEPVAHPAPTIETTGEQTEDVVEPVPEHEHEAEAEIAPEVVSETGLEPEPSPDSATESDAVPVPYKFTSLTALAEEFINQVLQAKGNLLDRPLSYPFTGESTEVVSTKTLEGVLKANKQSMLSFKVILGSVKNDKVKRIDFDVSASQVTFELDNEW